MVFINLNNYIMKHYYHEKCNSGLRSLVAAVLFGVASLGMAQQFRVLDDITDKSGDGYVVWGESISPNHRYVAGQAISKVTGYTGCFVYDLETDRYAVLPGPGDLGGDIRGVNDDGVAAGCNPNALLLSVDGTQTDLETPADCESAAWDLSDVGNVAVGSYWSINDYREHACVWKDGKIQYLPEPTTEEMGFTVWGTSANYCSSDASVIVGYISDDLVTRPLIIWRLQEDGSYVCDPICKEYFDKYEENSDKPYTVFRPTNVSRNGRYVSLTVQGNGTESRMARFDLTAGKIEEYIADGSGTVVAGMASESLAAADDGTLAGYFMSDYALVPYGRCACVWRMGEAEPVKLSAAYDYPELAAYDAVGYNLLYDITPDGEVGLGLAYDETYDYATYIIELGTGTSGIGNVETEAAEENEVRRYTVDGVRVDAPVKGLNIVKRADGSTVKVMVK